jgi:hypothetical protein
MVKKKLDSYKGKLSADQVAAGINAATKNAKRLSEDAALLFEAGRFPSAVSLAILSIEESGKASILRSLRLPRPVKMLVMRGETTGHTRRKMPVGYYHNWRGKVREN